MPVIRLERLRCRANWRLAVLAASLLCCLPLAAHAQRCPPHAREVSQHQEGNKLIIRCACEPGYVTRDKSCITLDEAVTGNPLPADILKDLFLGEGMSGDELRKSAMPSNWPIKEIFGTVLGSYMIDTGLFGPAEIVIEMVGPEAARDPAVIAAKQRILAMRRKEAQLFTLLRPEAGRAMQDLAIGHMPMKGRAAFLIGIASFRLGQHDQALKYLKDAQQIVPGDKGIDESLVIVRAVERAAWERRNPETARVLYARAFRAAGAQAAHDLGLQLVSSGDYAGAEIALREARDRMQRLGNTSGPSADLLAKFSAKVRADRAAGDRSMVDPPGTRWFDRRSKADLMFSALEYGQKDWARSLHFLESVLRADPSNNTARQAYTELKEIAATAK